MSILCDECVSKEHIHTCTRVMVPTKAARTSAALDDYHLLVTHVGCGAVSVVWIYPGDIVNEAFAAQLLHTRDDSEELCFLGRSRNYSIG